MRALRYHRHRPAERRAFTLLEALFSAGILFVVVVAVTAAVTAGQQNAFEAKQQIGGSLAAEEMMGRLVSVPYADLLGHNGHTEAPGAMVDARGTPYPDSFGSIGRMVIVTTELKALPGLNVSVRGCRVQVRAVDASGRILADMTQFIPEPQS